MADNNWSFSFLPTDTDGMMIDVMLNGQQHGRFICEADTVAAATGANSKRLEYSTQLDPDTRIGSNE